MQKKRGRKSNLGSLVGESVVKTGCEFGHAWNIAPPPHDSRVPEAAKKGNALLSWSSLKVAGRLPAAPVQALIFGQRLEFSKDKRSLVRANVLDPLSSRSVRLVCVFSIHLNFLRLVPEAPQYRELTNRELVLKCLQEMTVAGWKEFVRRFQPVIAGVTAHVASLYGDAPPNVVDDLTQEVYLRLCVNDFRLLRECKFSHENSIFAYLKYVSASVAHDHFKALFAQKRAAEVNAVGLDEADRNLLPGQKDWASEEERRLLLAKIEEVMTEVTTGTNAERDRLVFRLYYEKGLTASAIAQMPTINLTQKGIEALLSRIIASLRRQLLERRKLRISSRA